MPIYEYVCHACGLEKEYLQKINDALITHCPACSSSDYVKKVSAAGFRLKGTGWYVTDFRNKNPHGPDSKSTEKTDKTTADGKIAATTTTTTAAPPTTATAPSKDK